MRDDDLREELESHLAMRAEVNEREGMAPDEARAAARRQFGNLATVAEETRSVHVNRWLESLRQDVGYALRGFRRSPVFTAVAVTSLALGIGANSAVFTLADQILLRLLPVRNPGELVRFEAHGAPVQSRDYPSTVSYPLFAYIRANNNVFNGVIAQFGTVVNASIDGRAERIRCDLVSGNYYRELGIRAFAGRLLTPDDDRTPGAHPVAVLSYDFWKARFGGDPAVLGRILTLNKTAMTVVGISQPGFRGLVADIAPDITLPIMMKPQMVPWWSFTDPQGHWVHMFARLKPGVSIEQARAAVEVLHRAYMVQAHLPRAWGAQFLNLEPALRGLSSLRSRFEAPLKVLLGLVGFVLLMACANVGGLLSARAAARRQEFAVRLALGASRTRIIRQLMVESLLLALAGGVGGLMLAWTTAHALIAMLPLEEHGEVLFATPDTRVIIFTLAICTVAAILFGMAPAVEATRPALQPGLKSGMAGPAGVRFRKALVSAQVAVTFVLTICTGLFGRTLYNLRTIDPGFPRERLILFSLDPTLNGYGDAQVRTLYRYVEEKLQAIPGVRSVAMIGFAPVNSAVAQNLFKFEGDEHRQGVQVNEAYIGPGTLAALGVRLEAGREFLPSDTRTLAILTRSLARKYFGGRAVGKHVGFALYPLNRPNPPNIEIVGVAGDILPENPRDPNIGTIFLPLGQAFGKTPVTFHVRTALQPEGLFETIRREIRKIDPAVPVANMKTMNALLDEALFTERMIAVLSASFGLLAVLLAIIGLYGVIAFSVVRRTSEFGMRIALGAKGRDITGLVMRDLTLMLGAGMVVGSLLAVAFAGFVRALLYGVEPLDVPTVVAAWLTLIMAGLSAGFIPALRAARADLAGSLRCE